MSTNDPQEASADKYADKIAKLLRKAESTTPEEAEALITKAQQLMIMYAIDEQMVAAASGKSVKEEIVGGVIVYTGIFQSSLMNLGFNVARANNCKAHFSNHELAKPTHHDVHIYGFASDVERVTLLATSLDLQCAAAVRAWRMSMPAAELNVSKMVAFKQRREFILGFAAATGARLMEAKRAGEAAAIQSEAARSNVAASDASASVALVLRSRAEQVNDWYDTQYGKNLRPVRSRISSGGMAARSAGRAAGAAANIGAPGVGGRRGLGKG